MVRPVSLKTIATSCGLSVSTVSQILNNRSVNFSSQATKERVLETARRLGYRTNFGYKLLHGQSTQTFALLISMPQMKQEEHIRELIISLMDELDRRGYASYFSQMSCDEKTNLDKIRDLMLRGVEYFIFIGAPVGYKKIESLIETSGKHLIGTSYSLKRHVEVDSAAGVTEICAHLYGKAGEGFRYVAAPARRQPDDNRFRALRTVFPQLSEDQILQRYWRHLPQEQEDGEDYNTFIFDNARRLTEQILRGEPQVRAICCHTDVAALGAAHAIVSHGLTIGRDILLAGFNDNFCVRSCPYPISTVSHGWKERHVQLIDAVLTSEECKVTLAPIVKLRELPDDLTTSPRHYHKEVADED